MCVSVTIDVLWVLITVVKLQFQQHRKPRVSKPRQRQRNIRAKADHITDCVFPPCLHYIKQRGYTQLVRGLIWSEACRVGSRGGRLPALWVASTAYTSLPENSLWGGSFHCGHGNRRWIRWREWRRVSPYLLPFPSDPAPALWDRKPAPRFFPPEKGLLPPRRWTWRTSMRFFSKLSVSTSILWINI